jgi:pimeloyl-ACP methyl ester carboxylesterase/DNA-binding CsgD family transcriptional regulator
MKRQDAHLRRSIEDVFSLMPSDMLAEARREVLDVYRRTNSDALDTIKWAEFAFDGRLLRCGLSQARSMSTRLISNWRDDETISEMVLRAKSGNVRAGELLSSESGEMLFWFVPYTPTDQAAIQTNRLKAVVITQELVSGIIEMFNADVGLTNAEVRMIFQIVVGLTPAEAASVDSVSVETKRAHLKNASSKLNCTKQSEIMRLILGQMIHILHLCEAETSHMRVVEAFTTEHLGEGARLSVQRLHNGRLMRFWELGPPNGRPVLVVHGYLFPFLLLNANESLQRLDIRLVVPVRQGYLDDHASGDVFYDGHLVEQTVEDLTQFTRQTWQSPVLLLGHATGGLLAIKMVARNPELFGNFVIASINLLATKPDKKSYAASFFGGIRKLASDMTIYEPIIRQFQKTIFSSQQTAKFVLRRLFRDCATDVAVLDGKLGAGQSFAWYMQLHKHSPLGISSDFKLMITEASALLREHGLPLTLVHGPNDGFTRPGQIKELVANQASTMVTILPDGGHLAAASHPDLFWTAVAGGLQVQQRV